MMFNSCLLYSDKQEYGLLYRSWVLVSLFELCSISLNPHLSQSLVFPEDMWYLLFCVWLILHGIMPSNVIHVAPNDRILLFLWWKYAVVSIHGRTSGLSLYFGYCMQSCNEQGLQAYFWCKNLISFVSVPVVGTLDHMVVLFLVSWCVALLFLIMTILIYNFTNSIYACASPHLWSHLLISFWW